MTKLCIIFANHKMYKIKQKKTFTQFEKIKLLLYNKNFCFSENMTNHYINTEIKLNLYFT